MLVLDVVLGGGRWSYVCLFCCMNIIIIAVIVLAAVVVHACAFARLLGQSNCAEELKEEYNLKTYSQQDNMFLKINQKIKR